MNPFTAPIVDIGTLLAPASTGVQEVFGDVLPLAIPVLVLMAGLGIGLRVMGKFGVRR